MKEKGKKGFLLEGHRKPVTRRELISQGFLGGMGYLYMPSLLELMVNPARALAESSTNCPDPELTAGATARCPLICVQLRGGPQPLLAHRLQNGDFMSAAAYSATHGEPTMPNFNTSVFNCPIKNNPSYESVLSGFISVTSAVNNPKVPNSLTAAGSYLSAGSIVCQSDDDTNKDPLDPNNMIASLTSALYLPTILGTENTPPLCGYYNGPIKNPSLSGIYVPNVVSLQSSFGFGPAIDSLTKDQQAALIKSIKNLNEQELIKLAGSPASAMCSQFICSLDARAAALAKTLNIDPRADATLRNIWGLGMPPAAGAADPGGSDETVIQALIANSVIQRWASTGTIVIGGCDYHYGDRATSNKKDYEIGQLLGRIICTAAAQNSPVMVAFLMDGSVSAAPGSANWSADFGANGAAIAIFLFDPLHPPKCIVASNQIGYYTELNGRCTIDNTTFVGSSPERAAYALVLNYLNVNQGAGYATDFRRFITRTDFPDEQLQPSLLFGY